MQPHALVRYPVFVDMSQFFLTTEFLKIVILSSQQTLHSLAYTWLYRSMVLYSPKNCTSRYFLKSLYIFMESLEKIFTLCNFVLKIFHKHPIHAEKNFLLCTFAMEDLVLWLSSDRRYKKSLYDSYPLKNILKKYLYCSWFRICWKICLR